MRTASLLCIGALLIACGRNATLPGEKRESDVGALKDRVAGAPAAYKAVGNMNAPAEAAVASDGSAVQLPSAHAVSDSVVSSMIIRSGQANVKVDSLDVGIRAVRALASRVGGYVANSSISAGDEQVHSATIEIKLPAARFEDAISGLQPIGILETVSVNAEDVGEEYVDVAARASNGHKLEQRLIDILGTRTGKLKDVLEIERELARVREEIEREEGRMRYLRTRAALSTLAVTVHETLPVVAGTGTFAVLAEAFRQSWRNFIAFVATTIAAMGTLLPFGAIVAGIAWLVWRARRARHNTGEVKA